MKAFPQFTGSFGVPVNEHMGGGRTDFNLTNKMKLFYRYNHDDNIGVTGFGGVGLVCICQLQQREFSRCWLGLRYRFVGA